MKSVYVVDDDRDIVESISLILQKEGFAVEFQYDDKNVVQNIKKARPGVIILDVMFPEDESSGFRIARDLRADKVTAKIPILMLSAINERALYPGKFSDHDRDDAFLPVEAFVEKPIAPEALIAKVNELMG